MSIQIQLPSDVIPNIASYCDPRTTLSLGCACKEMNSHSEMQRKIFNVKYGAFASFETDIASVAEKIEKLKDTDAYLSSPNTQENLSFFEKIKKRYELFCGSQVKSALDQTTAVYEEYKKIREEFKKEIPTNHPYPLQEHAHRCIRLLVILDHENALFTSLEKIILKHENIPKEFSIFERIAFFVISYFHQDNNIHQLCYPMTPVNGLMIAKFAKKEITVSEPAVVIGNEVVQTKIIGCFDGLSFDNDMRFVLSNSLSFSIITSDKPYKGINELGRIVIQTRADNTLSVVNTNDFVGQDPDTGDIPISRLLAQMIMEIFSRTNCNRLEAKISDKTVLACAAGGMKNTREGENEYFLEDIKRARAKGKRFPTYTLHESTQELWKSEKTCQGAATHFTRELTEDNQLIPALVDFELQGEPCTWEALIEKQPLLGKGDTPILPEVAGRWVRKRSY